MWLLAGPVSSLATDSSYKDGERPWSYDEQEYQDQQSPTPSPMQHSPDLDKAALDNAIPQVPVEFGVICSKFQLNLGCFPQSSSWIWVIFPKLQTLF